MNKRTLLLVFCLFIAIGLPRLFSLEAHWSSDERTWLRRSAIFITAVQTGQFEQTLQAYHPGVTTMWLSGLRTFFENPSLNIRNLALARWFICFVISTGLIATFFLLHPLFGTWPATAAFSFLAINPFFLTQTRRVHTDALATTFILLTVLLFLIYCQNRNRHRYLIFSGITYGIALLSKSYALILLPWLPVCLFLFRDKEKRCFLTHIAEGGCFLSCTSLTVLALWPVFWTPNFALMALYLFWITVVLFREMKAERSPMWLVCALLAGVCLVGVVATQNVWPVFDGVNWAVTTPHEVEHFFLGKIVNDPGWFYYPIVLSIKSTPFVLPLAIFAILFLWKRRKRTVFPRIFKNVIAIGLVVILFTICLSLTSKKLPRYLLPAFAMFDILAGIGLFYTVKWIRARLKQKTIRNVAQVSCIGLILLLTAFPVFALHPITDPTITSAGRLWTLQRL